jgi:hypothetical protein
MQPALQRALCTAGFLQLFFTHNPHAAMKSTRASLFCSTQKSAAAEFPLRRRITPEHRQAGR